MPTVLKLANLNPSCVEVNSQLSLFNQQAMLCMFLLMDSFQVHVLYTFSWISILFISNEKLNIIILYYVRLCIWDKGE